MFWKGFQCLKRIEVDFEFLILIYGVFFVQLFECGFGMMIGNVLCCCLFFLIEGVFIMVVQIEGVLYEFLLFFGVVEDVMDFIFNFKQILICYEGDEFCIIFVEVDGFCNVIVEYFVVDFQIEICDLNVYVVMFNEEGKLCFQVRIQNGCGYVSVEKNFDELMGIGWILFDLMYSFVCCVNYCVEFVCLGCSMNYEQFVMELWINGIVIFEEVVFCVVMFFKEYLMIYINVEESFYEVFVVLQESDLFGVDVLFDKEIDEFDFLVCLVNCFKNVNINILCDLVCCFECDMMEMKNFGKKFFEEFQELFGKLGFVFGMDVLECLVVLV